MTRGGMLLGMLTDAERAGLQALVDRANEAKAAAAVATADAREEARRLYEDASTTYAELAGVFGVTRQCVSQMVNG